MLIVVAYDVDLSTSPGKKRLRNIAKICLNYGVRVQYSVFECDIDPTLWIQFKNQLLEIYDQHNDSLKFYNLGSNWHKKIEHFGAKKTPDILSDILIV